MKNITSSKILFQTTSHLRFIQCSNEGCKKIFQINSKEVEHGNGVYFCPECFSKPKTHHTIECANCLSIIDFIHAEETEQVVTYYSRKCTCCDGTVDDETHLSKFNSIESFVHS